MLKSISSYVLAFVFLGSSLLFIGNVAIAANPPSAEIKVELTPAQGPIPAGKLVRFKITHTFDSAVETGGACTVDLFACLSRFVPKGQGADDQDRNCNSTLIGSKTAQAGDTEVIFKTRARPVRSFENGAGRQVAFQTSSDCIDGSALEETIEVKPRAKKVSDPENEGVSPSAFIDSLVDRLK